MTSEATGKTRVVVVGGGVIGLCSAYFLRRVGLEVTLLEGGRRGQAASKGNAGWITPVLSAPVPAPGVISHGLWSLRDPDSPLYLKPSALPRLAPWLLEFATYSRRGPFQRGLDATAAGCVSCLAPGFPYRPGRATASRSRCGRCPGNRSTCTRPGSAPAPSEITSGWREQWSSAGSTPSSTGAGSRPSQGRASSTFANRSPNRASRSGSACVRWRRTDCP